MKKALLVKKEGMHVNAEITQILNKLGYDVDLASSFTEAAEKIRDGVDAVITGLYLERQIRTCFDTVEKSGIFVAITARDSGVPHVALATIAPEALTDSDKKLLEGIKVIDLAALNREELERVLTEDLSDNSGSN